MKDQNKLEFEREKSKIKPYTIYGKNSKKVQEFHNDFLSLLQNLPNNLAMKEYITTTTIILRILFRKNPVIVRLVTSIEKSK